MEIDYTHDPQSGSNRRLQTHESLTTPLYYSIEKGVVNYVKLLTLLKIFSLLLCNNSSSGKLLYNEHIRYSPKCHYKLCVCVCV